MYQLVSITILLPIISQSAMAKTDIPARINELQFGIDPIQDALAASFYGIQDSLLIDTGQFYTLGMRYDYSSSIAFKIEATHVNGADNTRGFFTNYAPQKSTNASTLYQFGIEWVF